jgi:hypothetical protein
MAKTLEQLIAKEKPSVVAKARERAAEIMLDIHLAELRERAKKRKKRLLFRLVSNNPPSPTWSDRATISSSLHSSGMSRQPAVSCA